MTRFRGSLRYNEFNDGGDGIGGFVRILKNTLYSAILASLISYDYQFPGFYLASIHGNQSYHIGTRGMKVHFY